MWVLESNGDFLQGKRMWLKPGKKYLFGRVKKDGVRFAIDHKTVSRKHFVIAIDPVRNEDVGQVHARSKITITDENSKAGTNIDGKLIKASSQELRNTVNSIRPGSCPHELVISWQPCVMTFMLNKKELKNGDLKIRQERVKDLDIRAVSEYLTEQTTHLVAQKRNTAKGLQALIEGRPIVTDAYIDALIYASTPIDLQEEENLCPLETDFDEAWPNPSLHLPPPGKEPTDKPAEAYNPNPARNKVFDKYTFIFFDQSQCDTLLPPITTGHGKALFFKVPESSSLEQGHAFVENAATNLARTIVVALNESADSRPWLVDYIDKLSLTFGQQPASQSDFLDAILANDASQLRKPRPQVAMASLRPSKSRQDNTNTKGPAETKLNGRTNGSQPCERIEERSASPDTSSRAGSALPESSLRRTHQEGTQQPPSQDDNPRPTKRAKFVPVKKPRPAFNDDFDPDAIAAYDEDSTLVAPQSTSRRPPARTSGSPAIKEECVHAAPRDRSPSESADAASSDDEAMDELLPAAAAMSREKSRREAEVRKKGLPVSAAAGNRAPTKPEKEVKLLNVREVVRAQREAEQDQERMQREELDAYNSELENAGPADLVQIKTFELPMRKRNGTNSYKGETWKPEWDGRKNFKGFRRARDVAAGNGEPPRRRDKIIVPLEPFRGQDYGLGDRYWEKSREEKERAAKEKEKRRRQSQKSQSQTQAQKSSGSRSQRSDTVQGDSGASNDDDSVEVVDDAGHPDPEVTRLQAEAENVLDHPIDVDAPRQTRAGETQVSGETRSSATKSTKAGAKRPASKTPPSTNRTNGTKRQKTLPVTVVHGSDSDDGDDSDDLKFKVGRGRRAKAGKK